YVYAPYRLVDLYVRGALAEHFAFVFFPLVLWAGRRTVRSALGRGLRARGTQGYIVAMALALAALVMTHDAIAIPFLPLALAYWAWTAVVGVRTVARPLLRAAAAVALAGALALGVAAIFWLPAFSEYGYVRVDQWTTNDYDLRSNFVYPHQLLSPLWGYGVSVPGPDDKLSFQLGLAPFVLAVFATFAAFWLRVEGRPALRLSARRRADLGFFALVALAACLFMLPTALPAWEVLRIASVIQFPWRLLTLTTLGLSLAGGALGLFSRGGPAGQIALVT